MKYTVKICLFALVFSGCSPNEKSAFREKTDLEMEVINSILPQLLPEHPPCMVEPIEGEDHEEYNKRLEAFYAKIDSVGRKVEIVSFLSKVDSHYIEVCKRFDSTLMVQHILNAPNENRAINSKMINKIENTQILLVKERTGKVGGLTDCYTLGQFTISRVGFNRDSTRAAFTYFIDNGSCMGGKDGVVDAELKDGQWQTVR